MDLTELGGIVTTLLTSLVSNRNLSARLTKLETKVGAIAKAVGAKVDSEQHTELRERVAVLESVKRR